jgi:hypothetical protein
MGLSLVFKEPLGPLQQSLVRQHEYGRAQFGYVGCLKGRNRSAIEFYSTITQQARK